MVWTEWPNSNLSVFVIYLSGPPAPSATVWSHCSNISVAMRIRRCPACFTICLLDLLGMHQRELHIEAENTFQESWETSSCTYMHLCKSTPKPEASLALHGYKNCCMCGVRLCFLRYNVPTRIYSVSSPTCRPAGGGLLLNVYCLYVGLHTQGWQPAACLAQGAQSNCEGGIWSHSARARRTTPQLHHQLEETNCPVEGWAPGQDLAA